MIIVGLVGKIAAGKSTVARALEALGAEIIDADRIAHDVLADPEVVQEIVRRFGDEVADAVGNVRRPVLAAAVFGPTAVHDEALRDLEAIVHPRVRQKIDQQLAEVAEVPDTAKRVVVLDVPLLMQVGLDGRCDRIVLVECEETERQRRLAARGWPELQRAARERAWARRYRLPPQEKTWLVDATGDPAYTQAQVGRLWASLLRH
jgi:dephospho-CoA kinase